MPPQGSISMLAKRPYGTLRDLLVRQELPEQAPMTREQMDAIARARGARETWLDKGMGTIGDLLSGLIDPTGPILEGQQAKDVGRAKKVGMTLGALAGLPALAAVVRGAKAGDAIEDALAAPWRMRRAAYQQKNPHSWAPGTRPDAKAAGFDTLADDADVWVFHATDDTTAEAMLSEGVQASNKPRSLARERYSAGEEARFAPGSGLGEGLYVGGDPFSVDGYGRRILAIRVPKSRISIPPEGLTLGKQTSGLAIADSDAMVLGDIPAGAIVDVTEAGRSGRPAHEAFIRAALARGEKVPPEVLAEYPELAR